MSGCSSQGKLVIFLSWTFYHLVNRLDLNLDCTEPQVRKVSKEGEKKKKKRHGTFLGFVDEFEHLVQALIILMKTEHQAARTPALLCFPV